MKKFEYEKQLDSFIIKLRECGLRCRGKHTLLSIIIPYIFTTIGERKLAEVYKNKKQKPDEINKRLDDIFGKE